MIDELDNGLRTILRREVLNGSDVEVVFDAPTKDWSARRNAPTVDVYLYDIREDLTRREYGQIDLRTNGKVVGRHGPPRFFKFSYLITAWTQRPEDEHRLLSAMLRFFIRADALPADTFGGTIADAGYSVGVRIALPPPQDRSISDVWSALGGELKPSLDLVVILPIDPRAVQPVGPLVLEGPRIGIRGAEGQVEQAPVKGRRGGRAKAPVAAEPKVEPAPVKPPPEPTEDEAGPGLGGKPGRIVRIRTTNDR